MHRLSALVAIGISASSGGAIASDAPAFDRPGIGFATSTLPAGGFAWEQGVPDAGTDKMDGIRTTTWRASTLLRLGLADRVELQLGVDTWSGVRVRGAGERSSEHGAGDGWASLKWAPARGTESFSWAVLATRTLPFGGNAMGGESHDYYVGVTLSWALPADAEFALHADRGWGEGGSGWLLSPAIGFPLSESVSGYVEAGYGSGARHMRAVGAGVTWMVAPRLQLDASFLRGLDERTTDWQAGLGLALYFDRRR